jgi:hypothetical protein
MEGMNDVVWNEALVDVIGRDMSCEVGSLLDVESVAQAQSVPKAVKWDGTVYIYRF